MSIYFKQSKNFMTENNIKFIEKTVLNDNFPYFFNSNTLTNKDDAFFSHQVLQRLELSPNYTPVNSEAFAPTIDILNNFVNSISEKVNFYTRISYNMTFNNGYEKSGTHIDHEYPHKQIIIYLNDADKKSKTCIVDEKDKVIKSISPEKYKGICFDAQRHFNYNPTTKHRLILVATFI